MVVAVIVLALVGGLFWWRSARSGEGGGTDLSQMTVFPQCGQEVDLSTAVTKAHGVETSIAQIVKVSSALPPDVSIGYKAEKEGRVGATPPNEIQLYVLRDNKLVAGTMISMPDEELQTLGWDQLHHELDLSGGTRQVVPVEVAAPRIMQMCPGSSWQEIWSNADQYRIMALFEVYAPVPDSFDGAFDSAPKNLMPYTPLPGA